jgi:hypothetical protein
MIPKIIFTYWEGDQLSELHYFTIYSLHKYNAELDIIIYTDEITTNILQKWNTNEHSTNIHKKIELSKIIEINPEKISLQSINFQKNYNFDNSISIIYKADFIRIAKLYEHGGIWFDMDILFIKPIPNFFFEEKVDVFIFIYSRIIPTGFLAAFPKSNFLKILYKSSLEIILNKKLVNYQQIGPCLWIEEYNKLDKNQKLNIKILDNKYVYPFLWNKISILFKKSNVIIPKNTFGIHWYNGAPKSKIFINHFDMNNINPNNSLIETFINNILQNLPNEIEIIKINFTDANNLEKIQEEYYNKISSINNIIIVEFIIPKNLLKTKVYSFYKCWMNGYCFKNSRKKIPKNINKIILKKLKI